MTSKSTTKLGQKHKQSGEQAGWKQISSLPKPLYLEVKTGKLCQQSIVSTVGQSYCTVNSSLNNFTFHFLPNMSGQAGGLFKGVPLI